MLEIGYTVPYLLHIHSPSTPPPHPFQTRDRISIIYHDFDNVFF